MTDTDTSGARRRGMTTRGGVHVTRTELAAPYENAIEPLVDALDERRGVLLTSSFEYPGRYTRWDIGFADPPLELVGRDRVFEVRALNERGRLLLAPVEQALLAESSVADLERDGEARDEPCLGQPVGGDDAGGRHVDTAPEIFAVGCREQCRKRSGTDVTWSHDAVEQVVPRCRRRFAHRGSVRQQREHVFSQP